MFDWIAVDAFRAFCTAGANREMSVAMMEMTTSNSIRVKPRRVLRDAAEERRDCIRVLQKGVFDVCLSDRNFYLRSMAMAKIGRNCVLLCREFTNDPCPVACNANSGAIPTKSLQ